MATDYSKVLITHTEFTEMIPEVWRRAEDLIFPNSPIEVIVDSTPLHKQTGFVYHFSLYVEGEWRCKAFSARQAMEMVRHIIKTDAYSWEAEALRLIPEWGKWPHVNETALLKVCGLVG